MGGLGHTDSRLDSVFEPVLAAEYHATRSIFPRRWYPDGLPPDGSDQAPLPGRSGEEEERTSHRGARGEAERPGAHRELNLLPRPPGRGSLPISYKDTLWIVDKLGTLLHMSPQRKFLIALSLLVVCAGLYAFTYGQWSIFTKNQPVSLPYPQTQPDTTETQTLDSFSNIFTQGLPKVSQSEFLTYIHSIGGSTTFSCDYADKDMDLKLYVSEERVRADTVAQSGTGYNVSFLLSGEDVYVWFAGNKEGYLVQGENKDVVFGMVKQELSKRKAGLSKSCTKVEPKVSMFVKPAGVVFKEGM